MTRATKLIVLYQAICLLAIAATWAAWTQAQDTIAAVASTLSILAVDATVFYVYRDAMKRLKRYEKGEW